MGKNKLQEAALQPSQRTLFGLPRPQPPPAAAAPAPERKRACTELSSAVCAGRQAQQQQQPEQQQPEENTTNFTGRVWESIELDNVRRERISERVRLAKLVLTIPIGSVANERRFSLMNLVVTALRNRLQPPHANVCMRVASSSCTYKSFPYQRAFAIWKKPGQEREAGLF